MHTDNIELCPSTAVIRTIYNLMFTAQRGCLQYQSFVQSGIVFHHLYCTYEVKRGNEKTRFLIILAMDVHNK